MCISRIKNLAVVHDFILANGPVPTIILGPVYMKTFSGENGTVSLRLYLPFTCIQNKSSGYRKTFQVADMFEIVLKTILCKRQIRSLGSRNLSKMPAYLLLIPSQSKPLKTLVVSYSSVMFRSSSASSSIQAALSIAIFIDSEHFHVNTTTTNRFPEHS